MSFESQAAASDRRLRPCVAVWHNSLWHLSLAQLSVTFCGAGRCDTTLCGTTLRGTKKLMPAKYESVVTSRPTN